MRARRERCSRVDTGRATSPAKEPPRLPSKVGAAGPDRRGPGPGTATPLTGRASGERLQVSGTFLSLVQICLSELRSDLARLFESGWAEPERNRACELANVLHQACERQGLRQLSAVMRSVTVLAGLAPEEAIPLHAELRKQFKVLLFLAEQGLVERRPAQARA